MRNVKFSPRQLLFLELFLSGYSMQDAARGAGYKGSTPQALCNSARRTLAKFSNNPKALFRWAGAREKKIAQLLVDMANNTKSELQQLKALTILSRYMGG
jgi:hypothetical protein